MNNQIAKANLNEISSTYRRLIISKQKETIEISELFLTNIQKILKEERIFKEQHALCDQWLSST